jgi:tetratricopeptide (TPR) repeat protein
LKKYGGRKAESFSGKNWNRKFSVWIFVFATVALAAICNGGVNAKSSSLPQKEINIIEGRVRTSAGEAVGGAAITLMKSEGATGMEQTTKADGSFSFVGVGAGGYQLSAKKIGIGESGVVAVEVGTGETKRFELVLRTKQVGDGKNGAASQMEFDDNPNFTVAGVTDWSNMGLHAAGTDARTSEALTRDTIDLRTAGTRKVADAGVAKESETKLRGELGKSPDSFEANHALGVFYCHSKRFAEAVPLLESAYKIDGGNLENSFELAMAYAGAGDMERARAQRGRLLAGSATAEAHRLAGDVDEGMGDPVGAVREYEQAVRMNGSEENYFAWGSEFLAHRAAEQAAEIFGRGVRLHPESARMLTGLGAAQYTTRAYAEAAKTLCKAADLKPQDATAYIFLGKIEKASAEALPCSEEKLARFAHDQPENADANYYYGLILWKRAKAADDAGGMRRAEELIAKCVAIEPRMAEGYLQMGIMEAERGEFAVAVKNYQKAIEKNSKLGEAHYRLGQAYKRLGEDSNARKELETYKQIEKDEDAEREKETRGRLQLLISPREKTGESSPR